MTETTPTETAPKAGEITPASDKISGLASSREFDFTLVSATYDPPRPALEKFARAVVRRREDFGESISGVAVAEEDREDGGSVLWIALDLPDDLRELDPIEQHTWIGGTTLAGPTGVYSFGQPPRFTWDQIEGSEFVWTLADRELQ